MEKLMALGCAEFTDKLASREPAPGGGGAAALAGALGVALSSMAGNLTLGRKKYAAVEEDIRALLQRGERIRARLLELADLDAEGFRPLAEAYGIPKDQPDRAERLEAATLHALHAPMEMMRSIAESIPLIEEMLQKGSAMLVSDVGCAALLAGSALECAALNVFVNTRTLPEDTARPIDEEARALLSEYAPRARAAADAVFARLERSGAHG